MATAACVDGLIARGHDVMVVTEELGGPHASGPIMLYVKGGERAAVGASGFGRSVAKANFHLQDVICQSRVSTVENQIRKFAPDVAHTNNLQGLGYRTWEWLSRLSLPTLVTLHDYSLGCLNQSRFHGGRSCAHSHVACAVTGWVKQRSLNSIREVGISAPSRFLIERESGNLPKHARFRRQWHLPLALAEGVQGKRKRSQVLRLGFVGRLVEAKGAHLLVPLGDALGGNFEMKVAGTGELAGVFTEAARTRKWLTYAGFLSRSRMGAFFDSIDLLLVPSQWEEIYSLVVREAMRYGVPSIVSNRGALPELVETGGGVVVNTNETTDWVRSVKSVSQDQNFIARLSEQCLRHAAKFNNATSIEQYVQMLAELATGGTRC